MTISQQRALKKLVVGGSIIGYGRLQRSQGECFSFFQAMPAMNFLSILIHDLISFVACKWAQDKWRNLLKASGIQSQGSRQGEKKRNMAWRPLPKSILHRVCELATIYPYPKGRKTKIAHIHHDSPDRSTDITLGDYRRILRSINGN
ncbi:UNVERIFIED_CONTAM: hypothetical protein Sangu_1367500 [Sesamum angustifolium]|uniref:Uncharacterized protein n=1 Tax=Sesamum angustifolium TaxID=2727405 RepID=A0AAW2N6G6_9LAMI